MKISVIILTKNEEKTIFEIVQNVQYFCGEVVVVDGHSKDNTVAEAEKAGARVVYDSGKGKGDGIRKGIQEAEGEILVFMDADGSHNITDIPHLVKPIMDNMSDMVIGSRILGGSDEISGTLDNIIRAIGSMIVAFIIAKRWKIVLTDGYNGFRAVRRIVAVDLNLKRNDFVIEQEMVINCAKKKHRVSEVASHEFKRQAGQSKLPTIQGWKFIIHLFKELFLSIFGK